MTEQKPANALIEVKITEYSETAAALAALREKYEGVEFPVGTPAGMKDAIASRKELRDLRVGLEKMRKEIKEPALERCRLIDAEAKSITAVIRSLEDPIDEQIKAEEQRKERERAEREAAEARRVEAIRKNIEAIRTLAVTMAGASAAEIFIEIEALEGFTPGEEFAEFVEEAVAARDATLASLRSMHERQVAQEAEAARIAAERAELERLRAEQAERDRIAREEREAAEAQARAEREAEARKLADERAAFEREQAEFRRRQSELMQQEEAMRAEAAKPDETEEKPHAETAPAPADDLPEPKLEDFAPHVIIRAPAEGPEAVGQMPVLHVYGHAHHHEPVYICGTVEALHELRATIDDALGYGKAKMEAWPNDGEGYEVVVVVADQEQAAALTAPYTDDFAQDKSNGFRPLDILQSRAT